MSSAAIMNGNALLRAQLSQLEAKLNRVQHPMTSADHEAMQAAQTRADQALVLHGKRMNSPMGGESLPEYHRRCITTVAEYSPQFRGTSSLGALSGPAALRAIEDRVFADVKNTARADAAGKPGALIAEQERDQSGRLITRYHGDPLSWMSMFMQGAQVGRINRDPPKQK